MTEAAKGHAAMIVFAALVSGSFSLGGMAAPYLDPGAFNAVRFVIASLAMGLIAWFSGGMAARHFTTAPWRYVLLGSTMALYFVTMFEALQITDPVSTGAVFTLTPVMSAPAMKTDSRKRATGIPRVEAVSSPTVIALSSVERDSSHAALASRTTSG